jgi:hypothetical protein
MIPSETAAILFWIPKGTAPSLRGSVKPVFLSA